MHIVVAIRGGNNVIHVNIKSLQMKILACSQNDESTYVSFDFDFYFNATKQFIQTFVSVSYTHLLTQPYSLSQTTMLNDDFCEMLSK